jgi:hypothetical protein
MPLLGIETHFLRRHPPTLYRLSQAEIFSSFFFYVRITRNVLVCYNIEIGCVLVKKSLFLCLRNVNNK